MVLPRMKLGPGGALLNRNLLSGLAIGIFAGFLGGYFVGAGRGNDEAPPVAAAPAGVPMPPRPDPMVITGRIQANQKVVAADPKNEKAWIALGNDYFDLQQAQNAVDAYAKALALVPGNPDVLTDQGVMYRALKDYPRAIADFKRASKVNPRHQQSLFNLGVVYAEDLKQNDEALKAWNRILAIDPASPQAAQARAAIASLKPPTP
jgi:tetratricopeptide (TPR) repeat protein